MVVLLQKFVPHFYHLYPNILENIKNIGSIEELDALISPTHTDLPILAVNLATNKLSELEKVIIIKQQIRELAITDLSKKECEQMLQAINELIFLL